MAKTFSIERATLDAFKNFGKNWIVLSLAGAIASAVFLIDRNGPNHLNQVRTFIKKDLSTSANVQEAWDKIKCFGRSLNEEHNPLKGKIFGLLMWLLFSYALLGLIRMTFNLGTKKIDLHPMVTMPMEFLRYLGALALMAAILMVAVIALGGLFTALDWFQMPTSVMMFMILLTFIVFSVYMLHFVLIPWCAADKATNVISIIKSSKTLTQGNLGHLLGFVILFHIVIAIASLMACYIALPIEGLVHLPGFAHFLVSTVMLPITVLGYTSVYKQLK